MDRRELTAGIALVLALVAGTGAVSAAEPSVTITEPSPVPGTLGAEVKPSNLNVDEDREVRVRNRAGGLAMDFIVTTTGGYVVEPATFTLGPDEVAILNVAEVGEGEGRLNVEGKAAGVVPGQMAASMVLSTRMNHGTGTPPWGLLVIFLVIGLSIPLGLEAARRRRQPR